MSLSLVFCKTLPTAGRRPSGVRSSAAQICLSAMRATAARAVEVRITLRPSGRQRATASFIDSSSPTTKTRGAMQPPLCDSRLLTRAEVRVPEECEGRRKSPRWRIYPMGSFCKRACGGRRGEALSAVRASTRTRTPTAAKLRMSAIFEVHQPAKRRDRRLLNGAAWTQPGVARALHVSAGEVNHGLRAART